MLRGGRIYRSFRQDTSVTQQHISKETLKRIFGFAKPYRKPIAAFLLLIIVDAALGAILPMVYKEIIDTGIADKNLRLVIGLAVLCAGMAIADAGITLAEAWYTTKIGEGLIYDLRVKVFDHVQKMPLAFFSRTQTGALVQRLNGDVLGAQQAFTSTLSNVVSNILTVVFVLAAMFSMSWLITLISLVLLPLIVIPFKVVGTKIAAITTEQYNLNAAMAQNMTEHFNVGGAQLVKNYGRPETETKNFSKAAHRVRKIDMKSSMYAAIFRVTLLLIASIASAIVYGLGGGMAITGGLTVGIIVALTSYLARLYAPLTALSNIQVDIMTTLVSFDRIFEVLDLKPMVQDKADAKHLKIKVDNVDDDETSNTSDTPDTHTHPVAPGITLSHVDFHYPSADEVSLASLESVARLSATIPGEILKDVTFEVPSGQLTALVGPSGAGKTTISQLISRMYDVTGGSITIGGIDVRDITQASLHDAIGVVTQDAQLFHDSLRSNLLFAKPDASDEEIRVALERAQASFALDLPDGIDTVVGDRGYRLSGGERQRIAIARLLLKAPAIVILDEATAHLDSESEAEVQAALDEALVGRTSLVIAHRLSTVRNATNIVVLDHGQIVEQGTHTQLLANGGLYSELYHIQFEMDERD
jgi:ATP-binding cassette subfamily B protein